MKIRCHLPFIFHNLVSISCLMSWCSVSALIITVSLWPFHWISAFVVLMPNDSLTLLLSPCVTNDCTAGRWEWECIYALFSLCQAKRWCVYVETTVVNGNISRCQGKKKGYVSVYKLFLSLWDLENSLWNCVGVSFEFSLFVKRFIQGTWPFWFSVAVG